MPEKTKKHLTPSTTPTPLTELYGPTAGDPVKAADVNVPFQAILDGMAHLSQRLSEAERELADIRNRAVRGISIRLALGAVTLTPGSSETINVDVVRTGGFTGPVTLNAANLPVGVTANFLPDTLDAGETRSVLTLTGGANVTTNNTPTPVSIRGEGGPDVFSAAALNVTTNAQPDSAFSVSAPSTAAVDRATSTTVTVPVTVRGAQDAVLSVTNLPTGLTASATSSTITFTAAPSLPAGTYPVNIVATSGTRVRSTALALTVTPAVAANGDFTAVVRYDTGDNRTVNGGVIAISRRNLVGPITVELDAIDPAVPRLLFGGLSKFATTANEIRVAAENLVGQTGAGVSEFYLADRSTMRANGWTTILVKLTAQNGVTRFLNIDVRLGTTVDAGAPQNLPPSPPVVNYFEGSNPGNLPGLPIEIGILSVDPEGGTVQYRIEWGDGSVRDWDTDGTNLTHFYATPGQYTITAQARDASGALSNTTRTTVNVFYGMNLPKLPVNAPWLTVSYGGMKVRAEASRDQSKVGLSEERYQYRFDFGDGTTRGWGGPRAEHTYAEVGTYIVKCWASDGVSEGTYSARAVLVDGEGSLYEIGSAPTIDVFYAANYPGNMLIVLNEGRVEERLQPMVKVEDGLGGQRTVTASYRAAPGPLAYPAQSASRTVTVDITRGDGFASMSSVVNFTPEPGHDGLTIRAAVQSANLNTGAKYLFDVGQERERRYYVTTKPSSLIRVNRGGQYTIGVTVDNGTLRKFAQFQLAAMDTTNIKPEPPTLILDSPPADFLPNTLNATFVASGRSSLALYNTGFDQRGRGLQYRFLVNDPSGVSSSGTPGQQATSWSNFFGHNFSAKGSYVVTAWAHDGTRESDPTTLNITIGSNLP